MQLSIICNIIYLSLLQINIQSYTQEKQLKILQIDDQFRRSAVQVDSSLWAGGNTPTDRLLSAGCKT